jgi:hypothetical protein
MKTESTTCMTCKYAEVVKTKFNVKLFCCRRDEKRKKSETSSCNHYCQKERSQH